VWFVDRLHGWVVGDAGAIYATVDGGATWWSQSSGVSGALLDVCFAPASASASVVGPSVGWIAGEDGIILETTQAGRLWVLQSSGTTVTLRAVASAAGSVWAVGDEGVILTAVVPTPGTPSIGFGDIGSSPYKTAIESLAVGGVISGFADGTFQPDGAVLRAQFAKMIAGSLGVVPSDSTSTRFTDLGLPDAAGYPHKYVQAAFDHAITNGTNEAQTLFAPWNPIRRDQVVSMIVRGAKSLVAGALVSPPVGTVSPFDGIPEPHGENLRIAWYNGLLDGLTGMGAGWSVTTNATRGEVAQMLYNLRLK
jgi:hypothetical protein